MINTTVLFIATKHSRYLGIFAGRFARYFRMTVTTIQKLVVKDPIIHGKSIPECLRNGRSSGEIASVAHSARNPCTLPETGITPRSSSADRRLRAS